MAINEILILVVAGIITGFINTLAGGGSIVSLSVLMLLGLPAGVANGTNRLAILMQTLTATGSFKKFKMLDTRKGLVLAIPSVLGSIAGAWIASDINEQIIEKSIAVILLMMVFFILFRPEFWLKGKKSLQEKPVSLLQIAIFFFIGIYGGYLQVGVGYFLLAGLVLGAGYDLVKANALKVMLVLLYTPFVLAVFILNKQVNYEYGLVLSAGSVAGAFMASHLAVKRGVVFVQWFIVIDILLTAADIFGLINLKALLGFL